jgi:hypothetical protein
MLGNYRVAAQLVASRVALCSTVSFVTSTTSAVTEPTFLLGGLCDLGCRGIYSFNGNERLKLMQFSICDQYKFPPYGVPGFAH